MEPTVGYLDWLTLFGHRHTPFLSQTNQIIHTTTTEPSTAPSSIACINKGRLSPTSVWRWKGLRSQISLVQADTLPWVVCLQCHMPQTSLEYPSRLRLSPSTSQTTRLSHRGGPLM